MKKIFYIFILLITLNSSQEYKSMRSNSSIIESIYLTIYSDDLTYVADKPFNKTDDGEWEISLPSLIIDENLTFIANAYNSNGDLIYQSNQIIKLNLDNNIVPIIFKSALESECQLASNQIEEIINDDNGDTQIKFKIINPKESNLSYSIYSDDGYEFNPDSGDIDSYDENSSYILDINYTKPEDEGDYGNLIIIANDEQNISYRFTLNVDENGTVTLK